jgi:hypothetical protein
MPQSYNQIRLPEVTKKPVIETPITDSVGSHQTMINRNLFIETPITDSVGSYQTMINIQSLS